jgi:hypothetical protein
MWIFDVFSSVYVNTPSQLFGPMSFRPQSKETVDRESTSARKDPLVTLPFSMLPVLEFPLSNIAHHIPVTMGSPEWGSHQMGNHI